MEQKLPFSLSQERTVRRKAMEEQHADKVFFKYHKVPKFSNARKLCCNLPKIQTKRPNLYRDFPQKDANGIANNEDPDQTAPLGAV